MSKFSFSDPEQESKFQETLSTFPPSKLILFEDQLDDFDLRFIFLAGIEFGIKSWRESLGKAFDNE